MGDPFKLIIEDDEGKRNVVPVDLGEVNVGRLETNAIRLNERNVSRNHMRLIKENGSIFAEDLNSYNGVFINGNRITDRQIIHEGDLIRIGDFHLELRGEGLARRAEDTTQNDGLPDLDSTQPGVRSSKPQTDKIAPPPTQPPPPSASSPTQPMAAPPPMPQPAAEPAPPPTPPPTPAPTPVDDEPTMPGGDSERHEPTAIIRMDQLQELEDQKAERATISGEKPKLLCVSTNFAGQEFEITTNEAVIGRTADNDISIDHRSVSRHHAKIAAAGNGFKIIDLGSANGTLINGEQYAQLALKAGDLIELGHVKFRFLPPGATYNLTEEEQAAIRGESVAATPAVASGGSLMAAVKANPFGAIGAGAALVAVAILLVWVLSSGDQSEAREEGSIAALDEPSAPGSPTGGEPVEPTGPAAKWIEKAKTSMGNRDWKRAARYANKALDKDADNEGIIDLIDLIETEKAAVDSYELANEAMADEDWQGAFEALGEIKDDSVYAEDRDEMRAQVKRAWIGELEGQAGDALLDDKPKKAEEAVEQIEAIDPDSEVAAGLRERIAKASEPRSPKMARGTKRNPKQKKDKEEPGAAAAKEKSKKDKPKKDAPKASGGDAKSLYKKGIALLQGNQHKQAIDAFNKCVQVDRSFCLCYRALGISHARAGNGPKAARYYRLYLRYCPTAKDAPQVEKLLEAYGL